MVTGLHITSYHPLLAKLLNYKNIFMGVLHAQHLDALVLSESNNIKHFYSLEGISKLNNDIMQRLLLMD